MSLSSFSDSDGDEDRETLKRILAKSGGSPTEIPNDDSDSDSSGSDVQDWFRQIQEKFSMTSADADPFPVIKPLSFSAPFKSDDEDVRETMAAIHRRFDQYQNGESCSALKNSILKHLIVL